MSQANQSKPALWLNGSGGNLITKPLRMNKKLKELKKFLIFEGISWLERWGNDRVIYVNDTFDNEGLVFTDSEIEFVVDWIYSRTGGY